MRPLRDLRSTRGDLYLQSLVGVRISSADFLHLSWKRFACKAFWSLPDASSAGKQGAKDIRSELSLPSESSQDGPQAH